jgi:hypothetical protein
MGLDGDDRHLLQFDGRLGFPQPQRGKRLLVVLPLVSAIAFMLIAEIDSPRHGIIRVMPQNLISLSQTIDPK